MYFVTSEGSQKPIAASHSMQRSGEAFGLEQAAHNGHNDSLVDRLVEENRCGQAET